MRLSREIAQLFWLHPSGVKNAASSKATPPKCNACDEERAQRYGRGCGGFVIVNAVPSSPEMALGLDSHLERRLHLHCNAIGRAKAWDRELRLAR